MFGLTAKERLAQMQQKGGKAPEPGKGVGGQTPVPGKVSAGPGLLKKTEPPKAPVVDPKKPVTQQPAKPQEPVKPKEELKPVAAPEPAKPVATLEPAKPKEEPKKPAAAPESVKPSSAPEPVKPKEEPKKPEPVKPKEEPKKPAATAPEPVKPKEEPKKPAATALEPVKPKEEPKKPATTAPEPVKPKEEPKKPATTAPEPVKPKEEPKKPAETAPEPVKPKEEPKKPAATAPEPVKPKEEPKKPAETAPEPVKSKEEPKKPAATAPEPVKSKEEPKKPAATAPEPVKPKEEPKKPEPAKTVESPKELGKPVAKPSDDFFRSIFYFSGMGTLVGSALAEGVYVPEKAQRNAVDGDEIEAAYERQRLRRGEEIIATARSQAQGLSTDFRHLQALLESLPTFTEVLEPQPLDRRGVDQVIHGHVYFQQEQHPVPFQTRAAHHGPEHPPPPPPPPPPAAAETQSHQAPIAKHPAAGAVAVLPPAAAFDKKHSSAAIRSEVPGSFAAAIDEFDRVSATAQQPVFGAPPEARESPRPHRRERPIAGDTPAASAAAAAAADRASGGARPYYGVPTATGQAESPASAWQDRYGQAEVAKFQAPRPFSAAAAAAAEIDSKGVKSWQLSHLRTLEAKGYQIVAESEGDVVKSYAPYLVSDRSQGVDRQRALHPNYEPIVPRSPAFKSPAQPSTFAAAADLPYCDL